eukprot:1801845-Rhodomonas_salina.5
MPFDTLGPTSEHRAARIIVVASGWSALAPVVARVGNLARHRQGRIHTPPTALRILQQRTRRTSHNTWHPTANDRVSSLCHTSLHAVGGARGPCARRGGAGHGARGTQRARGSASQRSATRSYGHREHGCRRVTLRARCSAKAARKR